MGPLQPPGIPTPTQVAAWRGGQLVGAPAAGLLSSTAASPPFPQLSSAPREPGEVMGGGRPGTAVLSGPGSRRSTFTSREEQPAPRAALRLAFGPGLAERRDVTSDKGDMTSH